MNVSEMKTAQDSVRQRDLRLVFTLSLSLAGMAAGIFCLWLSVTLEGTYGVMSGFPDGVLRVLLAVFGVGVMTASAIYPRLER